MLIETGESGTASITISTIATGDDSDDVISSIVELDVGDHNPEATALHSPFLSKWYEDVQDLLEKSDDTSMLAQMHAAHLSFGTSAELMNVLALSSSRSMEWTLFVKQVQCAVETALHGAASDFCDPEMPSRSIDDVMAPHRDVIVHDACLQRAFDEVCITNPSISRRAHTPAQHFPSFEPLLMFLGCVQLAVGACSLSDVNMSFRLECLSVGMLA